jgi:low temperature requirement protein LtrA
MSLISLILVLVIVGFVLWAVNTLIPMDAKIKTILNAVVILVLVLWLVSIFFPELGSIKLR